MWRKKPKKEYQPRNAHVTSSMMSKVKNRDSTAELLLRRTLFSRGLRYRLHDRRLIGRPDIVFGPARIVIFIDGDFWHGRALIEEGEVGLRKGLRTANSDWWVAKIRKTTKRDLNVSEELQANGWTVHRYWESEVLADVGRVADNIWEALQKVRQARTDRSQDESQHHL